MRDEQVDLIYDAILYFGKIECDCGRVIDPTRCVAPGDIEIWLDKCHVKEVKEIAEKYENHI